MHNPTSSRFGVTLVLTIYDDDGQLVASDAVRFQIGRGDTRDLSRAAPAATDDARSWRIESWVRVLEAPDRRTLRGES